MGAQDEREIELKMNAETRWGNAVNREYEVVRKDDDGDGLSSEWEKAVGRDPNDGKLFFGFDCGGWQDEGWKPNDKSVNIPGMQGFLDFPLAARKPLSLSRGGLNLAAGKNSGKIQMRLRSDRPMEVSFYANGKSVGKSNVEANSEFSSIELGKFTGDEKVIKSLKLDFSSAEDAKVEIDWIKVD